MDTFEVKRQIIDQALEMGADLAGVADVGVLKFSPSHRIFEKIGMNQGAVGSRAANAKMEIQWPESVRSALVIAVAHPKSRPELDWWRGKGTAGNDKLIVISRMVKAWIENSFEIETYPLPYHIESGGIFLKDAAVMAGLGCLGKNNMLVTPDFGPQVRLRAMLLSAILEPDGQSSFDPCNSCDAPCRKACPQKAFDKIIISGEKHGIDKLPGRNGSYSRSVCGIQMDIDFEAGTPSEKKSDNEWRATKEKISASLPPVKFCRKCEFTCPVGSAG